MENSPKLAEILATATAMYGQTPSESLRHPHDEERWPSLIYRAILDFTQIAPCGASLFSANGSPGRREAVSRAR